MHIKHRTYQQCICLTVVDIFDPRYLQSEFFPFLLAHPQVFCHQHSFIVLMLLSYRRTFLRLWIRPCWGGLSPLGVELPYTAARRGGDWVVL